VGAVLAYAVRPARPTTAPGRLAVIRAALVVGAFGVLTVEALGRLSRLTAPAIGLAWAGAFVGAAVAAILRRRRDRAAEAAAWTAARSSGTATAAAPTTGPTGGVEARRLLDWLMLAVIGGLLAVELLIALVAEPNNFDAHTYHLPRIEHWVAQGSVEFFPTEIYRQAAIPPGAEYLLTHLRLLTGGDALYNLLQWSAGVGCLLVASRLAAQLGGGRQAQLITAFLVATAPMVIAQATSTQTDLVTAAWVACVASLVLDVIRRPAGPVDAVMLGLAVGLTAVSKTTGLLAVGPLLVLGVTAQVRIGAQARIRWPRALAAALILVAIAAALAGPFTLRAAAEFGSPLGPAAPTEDAAMRRHDPAAVVVNALRIGHTALDTPFTPVSDAGAAIVTAAASLLGVPEDERTMMRPGTFPARSWGPSDDSVSFPIQAVLVLAATVIAAARPAALRAPRVRTIWWYALTCLAAGIAHAATLKWQPWGNRLLLYLLVIAAPLAGLWLAAALARPRRWPAPVAAAIVVTATVWAAFTLAFGYPRGLASDSVLTTDAWHTRFISKPQWTDGYRWAADQVRAAGPTRVGLVQGSNDWEYPWWLLLPGTDLVSLTSVLPHHPAADPATVDAIVCTGPETRCRDVVPTGWRLEYHDYVGYALPPA
jgi:hypothetical protein